ncbi:MAG: hypothetical protein KC912_16715 [Proteobacteria bacterium]|nr:hypothetical protein [Pseudomonadota bacterium]
MRWLLLCLCLVGCPKPSPYPETEGTLPGECTDDADNDADGLFDCNDPDCFGAAACQPPPESTDTGGSGPMTQQQYEEQTIQEACRILVACEFFDTVASCEASAESGDVSDCDYDAVAARACVLGLRDIVVCPDPFTFPTACEGVYDCPVADTGL